jgi:tRNA A37 threonylcarbamoyladenosine synthetase subunit TsaC/SUA5/YrdC
MQRYVDVIIDGGYCGVEPTTVIDMTDSNPKIFRQGMGDFANP